MDWNDDVLTRLAASTEWGYHPGEPAASEPAALAALALIAHGRMGEAKPTLDWLMSIQTAEGRVGVTAKQDAPGWPTALALIAWRRACDEGAKEFDTPMQRALAWLLRTRGDQKPRSPEIGHDTTLVGWPWVEGTHSWLEPTAMAVLALKVMHAGEHPRTREAVRLLKDRLLPGGGCNYGNTFILGQELRPHVQPTGLCLLALAGEDLDGSETAMLSLEYLQQELGVKTSTASLCYGLMALTAHGRRPKYAPQWLEAAAGRTLARDPSAYNLALLSMAVLEQALPMLPREANENGPHEVPISTGAQP